MRFRRRACGFFHDGWPVCSGGIQGVMRALVDVPGSFDMAAVLLRFEREDLLGHGGADLGDSPALWATVYNVGGDFFRAVYVPRYGAVPNRLGRWVADNLGKIRSAIGCVH